ncbi:ribonuclease HIII [Rubritalea sp.]|uniref:ribonuclease HIII n=1 Tax=Rubritalea sp. TaxID=2109375 RepID=UPI003EF5CD84
MAVNSYTAGIKESDVQKLRSILEERGFEFKEKQYAHFGAKKGKLNVTVYEKGPKVLVQGKETEDFVQFILEPEILGEARLGNEEVLMPEMFEPHFGIDESGKGDFFGPLVIAGAYVNKDIARSLIDNGVMDSKRISSDKKIAKLAELIRKTPNIAWEVIVLRPEKYNELYTKFGNLNRLLAWGHAAVIRSLAEKVPSCPRALSDQFAREELLQRALKQQGESVGHVELEQRTKGESDVAVAAASILAREAFVDWVNRASEKGGVKMPLGAGPHVLESAREIVKRYDREILEKVTKVHFKTTQQI